MALSNNEILAIARELPIPVPWDRDRFIQNLATLRGRPIKLIATDTVTLTDSPCGLLLTRDDDDLILHESGTSDYHIDQIVCHEIGHMVLGHNSTRGVGADKQREIDMCRKVLPDIDPATVHAVLGRTNYASDQERDAEMFATILMMTAAEAADQQSMMRSVFFRSR
ncbi:hypothetical protein [Mycobacterium spongiae]|uniref:IrrE N-terminal-like domain-containing protein n=1 Tax=Mycobacterium spongiae TaxID=886343 RepID=A0A975PXZ9_9MYCO|nr:hypothetical protein [Mycobacterium spongiae]QUR68725.1 hypothetical protein F6B93_18080 [Mycobacterium spongiae]